MAYVSLGMKTMSEMTRNQVLNQVLAGRSRVTLVLVFSVIAIGGCLSFIRSLPISSLSNCTERNTSVPQIPVYSNSTLLDSIYSLDMPTGAILEYSYEANDSASEVSEFYAQEAICRSYPSDNITVCEGDASDFGDYSVIIPNESQIKTEYRIVVVWDRCGAEWQEINRLEDGD